MHFLKSKLLDLFEEVEGTLNAYAIGASYGDLSISMLQQL
jgi:hypothetical protein